MAHELSGLREGDRMICFAFSRRPRKLPLLLDEIWATGAIAVLIPDASAAESATAADHIIRCRSHSLAAFNSNASARSTEWSK
jgi:DNA-binding MurR/RpiR family transcriptional regulator